MLVLLFLAVVAFVVLVAYLVHYHLIYAEVRRTSRCMRLREAHESGGTYSAKAVDDQGRTLYTQTYNLDAKQVAVECGCPAGNVVNHFRDVPYYDLRAEKARTLEDKLCRCDAAYDLDGQDVFFEGAPGLVRFLQTSDASFFQTEPSYNVVNLPSAAMSATASVTSGGAPKPVVTVNYDVDALLRDADTYGTLECACAPGVHEQAFTLPFYEKGKAVDNTKTVTCQCDAAYTKDERQTLTYAGTSGLVKFLEAPSTETAKVFTNLLGTGTQTAATGTQTAATGTQSAAARSP